jgi:hypothetical protein
MRDLAALANHRRSCPPDERAVPASGNGLVMPVDDTDTYQFATAARELEALMLHEQARHLADVRALLVELYQPDGVQVEDAVLDAQAEEVAAQERGERFLAELATRIHPGAELLELAAGLDDYALAVWREAAASLVDEPPPSFVHLRWRVEEEQRGELRGHAHLVRTEAALGARLRCLGQLGRWWHRRQVAELRGQLTDHRTQRERSEQRLAYLDAKLQVIARAEQARAAWITDARQVLIRGLAAVQVLADREHRPEESGRLAWPVAVESRARPRAAS